MMLSDNEYMSRKEYNKKYNSDVGYSLLVQNNIKRDDYARLNTGLICKVIGIKENKMDRKAGIMIATDNSNEEKRGCHGCYYIK